MGFMPRETVPVYNTWLKEKFPINNFFLDKQTIFKLALEDSFWHCLHPSLFANKQTTESTQIQVFLQMFHLVISNFLAEEDINWVNK